MCPLCGARRDAKLSLASHLAVAHFLTRLLTAVPIQPPYSCPRPGCEYSAVERQHTAEHLGRRHLSVLVGLVRETVPRFEFVPQFVPPAEDEDVVTIALSDTTDAEDSDDDLIITN